MTESFDVVIIGSGPAGSAYARTIKDTAPDATILLVEAGPVVSTPPGRHVRTIADPRERVEAQFASQGPDAHPADYEERVAIALSPSRGRSAGIVARPGTWLLGEETVPEGETGFPAAAFSANVGGMGAHWSGACPWPGVGERSDQLPTETLDDALDTARTLLHVTEHAFDGAPLGEQVRELLGAHYNPGRPENRRVQPMPLAMDTTGGGRYWTGVDAILGDLLTPETSGFELRAETVAKRLLSSDGVVDAVLLHDRRTNTDYEVRARFVVVAADPFRSPQLLDASGIRPPALGRYLNEHTMTTSTIQLDDTLRTAAEGAEKTSAGAVDVLAGVSWIPFEEDSFPFHGQITQWDASPIPVDTTFEAWPGSIVECSLFTGKIDVRADDRVEFDHDTLDEFGLPAIRIHYTFTDADQEHFDRAVTEAKRVGDILGSRINGLEPTIMPHGASLHYQGTMRFGTDPATSVVDTAMRVWGHETVYAGGNGVIPTPAACNPTLTNVALSIIGARDLAARLTSTNEGE